jgi:phage baseplate assembly protein W
MAGISPKLPLTNSKPDIGYALNKNIGESIKQNFKNLLLTNPGEKTFDAKFGVGLESYLFENESDFLIEDVKKRINSQVQKYMPFLSLNKVDVSIQSEENKLSISILYSVNTLSLKDILNLDIVRNS